MNKEQKITYRYSEAFKQEVLQEISSGRSTIAQCMRKYDIGGSSTISKWAKKYGSFNVTTKVIRVEKPDERDRIKKLKDQIKQLKELVADAVLDKKIADSTLEVICEQQGWDVEAVKKKIGTRSSSKASKNKRP